MNLQHWPSIIQGGMGVAISGHRLAGTVARAGQIGVVSGTGVAIVLLRDLWNGDLDGSARRALSHFPDQGVVERLLDRYFREGGHGDEPHPHTRFYTLDTPTDMLELTVASAFVEVWLAKEGHHGIVGFNLLEKTPIPNLPALYGAMLADVDAVLMGAGIPLKIPGVLTALSQHQPASYPLEVVDAVEGESHHTHFDPASVVSGAAELQALRRPAFLPIVTTPVTAQVLIRRADGPIDGLVIETPVAGGHNAPPRGQPVFDDHGELVYGDRDFASPTAFQRFERPFWMAGGYGNREGLLAAREGGAHGIQVGTAFAWCRESGFAPELRRRVLQGVRQGTLRVRTDHRASPTGFPFKVATVANTLSEAEVVATRPRVCDLGYLRHLVRREDGRLDFRCPSEPVDAWVRKGGDPAETEGRLCLCNALVRDIGVRLKKRNGFQEPPLVTSGDALTDLGKYLPLDAEDYGALDVLAVLLGEREASVPTAAGSLTV